MIVFPRYSTLLSAGEGDTKVLHSAQFVAFVVHLLTGWRPNTPLLCQAMREHEPEQIRKAIRAMIEGGAGDIKSNLIVDDNSNNVILDLEKYIQTETSARNRKNPDGTAIRKTVAEFKEDYNKRKAGRDEVVTRILKRETQIQEIHKLVDVAFNEVFLLVVPSSTDVGETVSLNGTTDNLSDSLSVIDNQIIEEISSSMNSLQNHAVYSISGVSFPEGYEEFGDSYLQIRILTDWYSSSADESETSRVDTINVPPTGQDSMEPKIVAPTKLRYNWITVQELIDSNAGIVSLETAFLNANSADCPRHWVTPSPLSVDPKAKKDKIKDSKVVPAEEDGVLSYPGLFPATLLSINCSGLRKSSIKSEEDEAIEAQQQALTEIQTGEDKPDRSSHEHKPYFPEFITLVVCIHADSVLPQKMSSDDSNNDSSVFTKHGIITDDIELVLQQFDINGDLKPMTFKIDLPSNGMMPITRQTIKIPSAAINNPNSDEMFFWLRLLTKASLHISFHSNAIVTVGKAETIWTGMSDRKALVKEGDALPTRPTSEHLIFRLPLEFVDKDIEGCCAVFLHIEDVQVENCVSILVSGSSAYSLPNTQNALVKLNKGSSSALLGRVFPSQVKNTVASFHWKLIILSYHSLVDPPLPIASQPVTQRFSGKYYPNKKIQLFRDVYKVEKSSFPISLRLRLTVSSQEEQEKSQSKQLNIPESTCLVFKIFRKFESETKLVHEYRGRGTISCYDVAILDFLNNGEDPGSKSAVPTDPKATKGKVQTAESIDLIFQCCVDETAMQVPSDWRSKFPFYYDRLKQSSEEENTASPKALALEAPKISPFGWCLDILEGKTVQVSHDTVQLLKHLEVKNSWESESAGRSSKAASALEYYRLRRQMESTAGENKQDAEDIKTKMLETLNQCLEGVEAADQLKSRYSYLYTLSKVG